MRKGTARMSRPALRLLTFGTILGAAVFGSALRADATVEQPHLLAARPEAAVAAQATLPAGFQESIAIDGLAFPTAVRFSPDGRVFVAQQSGVIKVFGQPERHDTDGLRRPAQ
jgi:hypothetical protein